MSGGIGRVPGTPTPIDTTTTAPASDTTTTAPVTAPTTTRTPTSRRPTPPSGPPNAGTIVPATILNKYGLDPNKPETSSKYEGAAWNVGYYPYDGDIQYVAFGKYKDLFNNPAGASDAHGYWESYGNPPSGLESGSWIGSGSIDESDFERATGIDISGDRTLDNRGYKMMREAGAPAEAKFALRDKDGKQLAIGTRDKLVPTIVENGKFVEVEVKNQGEYFRKNVNEPLDWGVADKVVWRLKGQDGKVKGAATDKAEDRYELAGAKDDVKFDFLDATGEPMQYNPSYGDQIVATYKDANKVHAFVPKKDASGRVTGFEHQTLNEGGTRVTARETVTAERAKQLQSGKEVIHRIQERSGALKGDGKVGDSYDMGWWGKCHNVAAIGASSVKLPEKDVKLVTNLGPGDSLGMKWQEGSMSNLLTAKRNTAGAVTGYTLKQQGGVTGGATTRSLSVEEGNRLATDKKAQPVVISRTGAVKPAETTTVGTDEVTAMVAHMGDGAVEYKGSVGNRYYGFPDQIKLKDGRTVQAFITETETQGGKKATVGSKSGSGEYDESDRSVLRGPGLDSRTVNNGGRSLGWTSQPFAELQASKTDKLKTLTVVHPDGRTEKIGADKISALGWENKFDITPTQLWGMHKKVGAKGSSVIERDPGTHVWNYTMNDIATKPLKKEDIPSHLRDAASKPGMMKGTTGDDGKYFFKTSINGQDYTYWAKFDGQGNLKDYAYLDESVPDFFWTQHTKDPIDTKWTGEAQAPGARMEDIQKLYNASTGALKKYEMPGGFLSMSDLNRKPVRP